MQKTSMPHHAISQLSQINFRQFQPGRLLRPYVQSYWSIKRPAGGTALPTFFLHPDGGAGLVFNFGSVWSLNGEAFKTPYLFSGPTQQTSALNLYNDVDAIGIRFHPGMAYPFMEQPLAELRSHLSDPLSFATRFSTVDLADQLFDQPSNQDQTIDRISVIEQHLSDCLRYTTNSAIDIRQPLNWLNLHKGQASIEELTRACSISQRQLERLFQREVGMTAKQYNKLQRVRNSRELIRTQRHNSSLSDIALISGYYDQAHFIREFKSVIGITPGLFMSKLNE
ncbi:helix-turn-helix domain-containing protein [Amphritea sp. HPY]|uniref:helix-turn-helix domain-containing protein n=1 Tax=Amphritea sp. HPY TaxID=3421652 RepID=UPI003D7EF2BC